MRTFKDQYGPSRFVDAFLGWTLDPFDYWLMAYVLVAIAAEFKSPEPAQATSFSHRLRAVWSRARRFLLSPAPSMPRHALFVLLAGVAFAGGRLPARQTPPVLDQIQPIRLAPARNVTLERPVGLALDQDGGFYVVDGKGGNVLRYSGSGAPVTRYGAPGDAPGQLRSPGKRRSSTTRCSSSLTEAAATSTFSTGERAGSSSASFCAECRARCAARTAPCGSAC